MERTILHIDMNGFYASVECLHNPAIRHLPVAVGGDAEKRHGIILAKNEIAKKYNIKTGEALWQAREKCKDLVIVPPHYGRYLRFSEMSRKIYADYTNRIEAFGLDENWLDLTSALTYFKKSGKEIADEIRERIKHELGITASVGVSWNKIFAKLGSDYKKPDATTVFSRENYKELVWPLHANELLGIGSATYKKLLRHRLLTIGDVATTPVTQMQIWFGKWGHYMHTFANGMDTSPVAPLGASSLVKSVGNSTTTPRDLTTNEDVSITFTTLCESVAARLRVYSLLGRTVQISLRDNQLLSFERQMTLDKPTCLATELHHAAMQLFQRHYCLQTQPPLRSVGVRATNLVPASASVQLDLFDDEIARIREETLERTVDQIRRRYGHHSILRGNLMVDKPLGYLNPQGDHIIHPVGFF